MTLYLDASVLVALLQNEQGSEAAAAFLGATTEAFLVSDLARGEVASAVSRGVRMRQLTPDQGVERLQTFEQWLAATAEIIATEPADVRAGVQFVGRFDLGLQMPDAIHIAAARARTAILVTLDRRMATAADSLGVTNVIPE